MRIDSRLVQFVLTAVALNGIIGSGMMLYGGIQSGAYIAAPAAIFITSMLMLAGVFLWRNIYGRVMLSSYFVFLALRGLTLIIAALGSQYPYQLLHGFNSISGTPLITAVLHAAMFTGAAALILRIKEIERP